ncbi:MAG TPA: hypothetical protein PLF89_04920 [bacterium]|nr:hypothetical protein [bacterium]
MNGSIKAWMAGWAALLALGTGMTGCSLEAPKAPSWDTTLNIPVADHTYSLDELIDGEENLKAGLDSILTFHFEEVLDTIAVGDHLTLPDIHESLSFGLDAFRIPNVPVMADRFLWASLTPQAAVPAGTTGVVSPFFFNYIPSSVHNSQDLLYALLVSGMARLHLYNRLTVDLENLILSLQDSATGRIVVSSPLVPRIAALDSGAVNVDMRGCAIPRQGRWLLSGNSPGSKGAVVPIDGEFPFDVVVELFDFVIAAAEARIPAMTIERTDTVQLGENGGNAIAEAAFASGRMMVSLDNHSPFASPEITFTFPQIRKSAAGAPLEIPLRLQPDGLTRAEIDLAGLTARLPLPPPGAHQAIEVAVRAVTDDMRSSFKEVGEATRLTMRVDMENLRLDHFNGRLATREVRIDSSLRDLDISGEWGDLDGVTLREARLLVEIFSTLNLPVRLKGALYGFSGGRAGTPFAVDISVPAASGGPLLYRAPLYTVNNSGIVEFINQHPEQIAVAGSAWIGDSGAAGGVRRQDRISARFSLELPFILSWEERWLDGDLHLLEISPPGAEGDAVEERDDHLVLAGDATEHLRSAELELALENRLPAAGEVTFYFATDSSRLFTSPDLVVGPVTLEAAAVDASGRAAAPALEKSTLTLSAEELRLFQNGGGVVKNLYFSHRVRIAGSGSRSLRLHLADYLRVQALLRLVVRIGG